MCYAQHTCCCLRFSSVDRAGRCFVWDISQRSWLSIRLVRYVGVSQLCDWGLYVLEQELGRLLLRAHPASSATDCSSVREVQAGLQVQLPPR